MNAVFMESWRGSCFKSAESEAEPCERFAQAGCGGFTLASAREGVFSDMNNAIEEGSGGYNDAFGWDLAPIGQDYATELAIFETKIVGLTFQYGQMRRSFDHVAHPFGVGVFVALGPKGLYGRTFFGIECTELDAGAVAVDSHLAAQCVQFADDMRLGDPANGGVAGHSGNGQAIHGEECRVDSHAGRGQCRFASRVAGTDDDNIELIHGGY